MTTKEYLAQIRRLDMQIQNKLSDVYKLKTMACSVNISDSGERVKTSGDKDRLGNAVAKIVDLEKEIDSMVDSFVSKRKRIIEQIDNISDDDEYNVLSMRYVGGKTFDEIAKATNWSIRKVFSIHGKALQDFEKLYGNEYLKNVQ